MSGDTFAATPYKGLVPYSEEDAPFFFGREAEREIITANLMASRLTLLYGASGVGKSSVLRAGVAHHLRRLARENLDETGSPQFAIAVFNSWRDDPIAGLETRVRESAMQALNGQTVAPVPASRSLLDNFRMWTERVGGELLIILDQFEEYFLYHGKEDGTESFAVQFPHIVNSPDLSVNFLISIRDDSLAKLDRFQGQIPTLFENRLGIEHLDRTAARSAIERPIEQFNRLYAAGRQRIGIESELIELVLDQVKAGKVTVGEAGRGVIRGQALEAKIETPYLQLVMTRLWDEEMRAGSHALRLKTLESLGGAQRIVRTHLDAAIGGLPADEQYIAAEAFHFLVTPTGTKIAHTIPDLAEYSELPQKQLSSVLEKLAGGDVRILRAVAPPPDQPGAVRYEIFHDVLASAILDWRARYTKERDHKESEGRLAHERRRVIRLRLGVGALSLFLLALFILIIVVLRQQEIAESQEAAARAISLLAVDPTSSLKIAVEAASMRNTQETEYALRKSLIESSLRAVLRGHDGEVYAAAFSPDDRLVVTASEDHTARVWETNTGRELHVLRGHKERVISARFNPQGNLILTASDDKTAALWEAETGQLLHKLEGHTGALTGAAFSPDGKLIVTSGYGNNDPSAARIVRLVRVWEVASGAMIAELQGHSNNVNSAVFSPDSKLIVTASSDGTARVWEAGSGKQIAVLAGRSGALYVAAFSPDGKYVVTAGEEGLVLVWKSQGWTESGSLKGHSGDVVAAAFGAQMDLVTASSDGSARDWSLETQDQLAQLAGHTDRVRSASLNPDRTLVVTASDDGTALVSFVKNMKTLVALRGHSGSVNTAAFSSDGRLVVTASRDKTARVWEVSTERPRSEMQSTPNHASNSRVSPDGKLRLTIDPSGTVTVTDSGDGREVMALRGHEDRVNSARFSRDGLFVVTSSDDTTARVWEAMSGRVVAVLSGHALGVTGAAFSSDGKLIVTASRDKTARVWELSTQKTIAELVGHADYVNSAVFSPDDKFVVTTSDDRTAAVWEWRVSTNVPRTVLVGHSGYVIGAAFSPDGNSLITISRDSTIRLWETARWQNLTVLHIPVYGLSRGAFSSDGRFIVAGGKERVVRVYACEACAPFKELLELARKRTESTATP